MFKSLPRFWVYGIYTSFALVCCFSSIQVARADHEHEHHEPPPLPTPIIEAPPPAPPPPPSTSTPSVLPQFTFQPLILPTSNLAPTDTSSIGGALGRAKGLPGLIEGFRSAGGPKPAKITIPRDNRYSFTGNWIGMDQDNSTIWNEDASDLLSNSILSPFAESHKGRVSYTSQAELRPEESLFMPIDNAHYTRVTSNELEVRDGAVLVKTGKKPVFVSTHIKGKKVLTKVDGGAMAMVSNMDDKATVLNLHDCRCGSCVMCCCSESDREKTVSVPVEVGQIAEMYATDNSQTTGAGNANGTGSKVLAEHKIENGLAVKVFKCHYVSAIRRFNLDRALSAKDLNRLLKTAAATMYAQRRRTQ